MGGGEKTGTPFLNYWPAAARPAGPDCGSKMTKPLCFRGVFVHIGSKMGPGGAPRSDAVKTNRFLSVLEPAGAQKAISG